MKTIRQIADEIGVSKQAVQQKLKKEPLASSCRQYTTINGNTTYIKNQGIELIKSAFSTSVASNLSATKDNDIVDFFKEQLKEKDKQLAEKDKQISDLTSTVLAQAQSINADRHTELVGTVQQQLTAADEQEPNEESEKIAELQKEIISLEKIIELQENYIYSDIEESNKPKKRGVFGLFRKS
jgi:predicted transcriptional regulator